VPSLSLRGLLSRAINLYRPYGMYRHMTRPAKFSPNVARPDSAFSKLRGISSARRGMPPRRWRISAPQPPLPRAHSFISSVAREHWASRRPNSGRGTSAFFAAAPYHEPSDPLDRVLAYVAFRKAIIVGDLAEVTCLVGTLAQEIYISSPTIRDAYGRSIFGHAATSK